MSKFVVDKFYPQNTATVMEFVYDSFCSIFSDSQLQQYEISVLHWNGEYPQTAPKRLNPGIQEDYIIQITSEPLSWCQIVYQLSHELSHVAMGCYPEEQKFRWLSECLCEGASLYILDISPVFFQQLNSPYVETIRDYLINKVINKSRNYTKHELKTYISKNLDDLTKDPTEDGKMGRPRNAPIGTYFYKIIKTNPGGWQAISLFADNRMRNCMSLDEFMIHW